MRGPKQYTNDTTARERRARASLLSEADFIAEEVPRDLASIEVSIHQQSVVSNVATKSEVSPWLERTRWPAYLSGVTLSHAAVLARLPEQASEPVLFELVTTVEHLVEQAHQSISEDRINFFDQRNITSFLPNREVYSRPLVYKLQQSTYRRYVQSWKKALCFVVRSNDPTQPLRLRHILTSLQTARLDTLLALALERVTNPTISTEHVQRACLDLCISLLDHQLKGDIFESAIVGFLAVLGIDEANSTFYDAPTYTPKLSGFIKISQLLVLEKAIIAVEDTEGAAAGWSSPAGTASLPLSPLQRQHPLQCTPLP